MTDWFTKIRFSVLAGLLLWAGFVVAQTPVDSVLQIDSIKPLPLSVAKADSVAVVQADTSHLALDSIPQKKKSGLDAPVTYESQDSMIWNYGGYASLYGEGKVNYENVELTAAVIKMQMDSSLVYADGVRDSTGEWYGTPVFMDGSTP